MNQRIVHIDRNTEDAVRGVRGVRGAEASELSVKTNEQAAGNG